MKKYILNKTSFYLLLFFTFITSCNAQEKKQMVNFNLAELKPSLKAQLKIKKSQDANKNPSIVCGLQDKLGNLWFGTAGEGVYKYNGKLFTQYTIKDGLNTNDVYSILEAKNGTIWFGTTNGICRFEGSKIINVPISFHIRPFITDNSYYTDWAPKYTVWSMMQDKAGTIWFGIGDGVYYYKGVTFNRLLHLDNIENKDSLKLKLVSDIIEDKDGIIWFASGMPPGSEGFCRYDGKKIESFKHKNEGWIRKVIQSKNGDLLLATRRYGVWSYDGKSFKDYSQPMGLVKPSITDIIEDKAGSLWIASDYGLVEGDTLGGLWHANQSINNLKDTTYTKICNKEVFFVMEDKNNNIWFSTRNWGLYYFDRKVIKKFSEE